MLLSKVSGGVKKSEGFKHLCRFVEMQKIDMGEKALQDAL